MRAPPILRGMAGGHAPARFEADALGQYEARDADSSEVAGFGNLRFAESDLAALQAQRGTGAALLVAWQRYGTALPGHLRGDFAICCRDGLGRALIAVDRFATHALYWAASDGRLAFSTRPADVPGLVDRSPEIDPQSLHAYLYFHVVPAPLSICAGVRRLDIGEAVVMEPGDAPRLQRYWRPTFDPVRRFDFDDQRNAFLAALREGVGQGIGDLPRDQVGCFLSGGTDSSTIAGLAGQHFGAPARTFSIVFDEADYDERRYSRLAASHFRTEHVEHVLTPEETDRTLDRLSRAYEQPFGNSSAIPTHVCAELAAGRGVRRMLGGDGGDELYGGNSRYALAWLLGLYRHVPRPVRERVLEPALAGEGGPREPWLLRKSRGYVQRASTPMPDQIQGRYNLLNHFGRERVLGDALLAAQGAFQPLDLEREVWSRTEEAEPLNRLLAYDLKFTLGDSDLQKVTRMCHAAGVEVAFPMLADALVRHAAQLPAGEKLRRTQLRHFFRKSLRGFLPDEIIDKSKHGFGMPFGEWLLRQPRLAARADEALRSLAQRGLVRGAFIGELRERMGQGHAGYYGTMVWILMALELWLRESVFADVKWSR